MQPGPETSSSETSSPDAPDPWPPAAARADAFAAPAAWLAAQGAQASALADLAALFGALDDRLRRAPEGLRQRLALIEAADLSWQAGDRLSAERLALWAGLRLSGVQEDAQALARAAWAARRLAGGPGPEGGSEALAAFLERQAGPEADAAAPAAGAGLPAPVAGLHPLAAAARLRALWLRGARAAGAELARAELTGAELAGAGRRIEAAVLAGRLAGAGVGRGGAVFLPQAFGGAPAPLGETPARWLSAWAAAAAQGCRAALLHLDRLEAWRARAEDRLAGVAGRTPRALVALLADWPMVSAGLAEAHTGASRAAVQRGLDRLAALGLLRELTGQGRFRIWAARL